MCLYTHIYIYKVGRRRVPWPIKYKFIYVCVYMCI